MKDLRIRCLISAAAYPRLHEKLKATPGRMRQERLRALAHLGALVEDGMLAPAEGHGGGRESAAPSRPRPLGSEGFVEDFSGFRD
jgi:hypothetical protein